MSYVHWALTPDKLATLRAMNTHVWNEWLGSQEIFPAGFGDEFKSLALHHAGLTDHPKADKAYALAYEWGHAYGYHSVWQYLQDLVDLVK